MRLGERIPMPVSEVWIPTTPEYVLEHGGRVTVQYELSTKWDKPLPDVKDLDAAGRRKIYDVEEDARRRKEEYVRRAIAQTYPTASIISLRISGRVATLILEFRPRMRR